MRSIQHLTYTIHRMTRIMSSLICGAAIFTLSAACAAQPEEPELPIQEDDIFTIIANAPGSAATKTEVNSSQNGALWTDGDAINVFHAPAGSTSYVNDGQFTIASTDENFTGSINGTLTASNDWYAFYPYLSLITTPANSSKGYVTVGSTASGSQTQEGNDDMRHLAGSHIPLYGKTAAVSKDSTPELHMHQTVSVAAIDIKNGSGESITIDEVSISAPEDIVGTYYIDFSGADPSFTASGDNYVSSTARLKVSGAQALADGASAKYYIAIKPFTAKAGSEISVSATATLSDGSKAVQKRIIKLSSATSFRSGKIKTIALDYGTPEKAFTWDLSKQSYESASESSIKWVSDFATMTNSQTGGTAVNNYIPPTRNQTRFYNRNHLYISAAAGYTIKSVEFIAASTTYANALAGSTWSNASATVSGTHVTVVPENGQLTISAAITGTSGISSVIVYYEKAASKPSVITGNASDIGSNGAILHASYSSASSTPREIRFEYGTSASALTQSAYYNDGGLSAPAGSFSLPVNSLAASTTYYYRAVIQFGDEDYYGEVLSFTTKETAQTVERGWLELPANQSRNNTVNVHFGEGTTRNYSIFYDETIYAPLWTAYPLTYAHTQGDATGGSWQFNPQIPSAYQIDITSKSYPSAYGADAYARGHQLPAADRKSSQALRAQTYYATNQLPQIQNKFNDGIWSQLENGIRAVTSGIDTVYVVTGPAYQTVGGNETIEYLSSSTVKPAKIPVANYFWKAVLKVRRDASGNITAASAIGFWFEHKAYSNSTYANYAVSVDRIEELTGLDLFTNLPDTIEASAEANTSWTSFQNFK